MALQGNLADIGSMTVTPVDIPGALAKGDLQRTQALQNEQTRATITQQTADDAALKDYLSLPDTDLYTAKGVKTSLQDLKGRVSPKTYMDLAERGSQLATHETTYANNIAKQSADALVNHKANNEFVLGLVGPLAEFKGTDTEWPSYLAKQVDAATTQKRPDGTPLIPATEVDSIKSMPQTAFKQMYASSQVQKDAIDKAYKEAQTSAAEALATDREASALMKGGAGPTDQWSDPATGTQYLKGSKSGKIFKVEDTGELTDVPVMPAGAVKLGAKGAVKADAVPELTADENLALAEYQTRLGKAIPGIPVGTGAAASKARTAYLKAIVGMIKDRGITPDEAGLVAIERDGAKAGISNLLKTSAVIESGERDLKIIGKKIEDELKKLGGPDSPIVRKFWNKASTEWAGDPQFSRLNTTLVNFQETAARVLSGQSGAGGTPVSYLALAEKALGGKTPTLKQFSETNQVMNELFDARKVSTEGALKTLEDRSKLPDRRVPDADQKARDADAVAIQRAELQKARQALITLKNTPEPTDPTQKKTKADSVARAEGDVAGLEREIKRMGGALDAAPAAGAGGAWKDLGGGVRVRIK